MLYKYTPIIPKSPNLFKEHKRREEKRLKSIKAKEMDFYRESYQEQEPKQEQEVKPKEKIKQNLTKIALKSILTYWGYVGIT